MQNLYKRRQFHGKKFFWTKLYRHTFSKLKNTSFDTQRKIRQIEYHFILTNFLGLILKTFLNHCDGVVLLGIVGITSAWLSNSSTIIYDQKCLCLLLLCAVRPHFAISGFRFLCEKSRQNLSVTYTDVLFLFCGFCRLQ